MYTSINIKRFFLLAFISLTSSQLFADTANAVWVRAEATPVDGGLVFVNWNLDDDDMPSDYYSEFKRAINFGASTAFILAEPAEGWQLAGFVRDNGNQRFDNGDDKQIYVWPTGFFTAVYDPTEYPGDGSSSSSAQYEAEAALEDMENPTDLIYAVFTQGDVAKTAEGQEWMGKVWADKLNNEVGDEVTFSANGDYISPDTGGKRFYKFDHWTSPSGETITDRTIKVTVEGGGVYRAHFTETTEEDFRANEREDRVLTSIESIVKGSRTYSSKFYNLQGQVVEPSSKGVYIQNGKKFVVK